MTLSGKVDAVLFDAYGTLLNLHSVTARAEEMFPGRGAELSALWRDKQLDYTRLRTISDRYADFAVVTADALDYTLERLSIEISAADRQALLKAYWDLPAFPECEAALQELRSKGLVLGILSNGTPDMLGAAMQHSRLGGLLDHVISVDAARVFKTDAAAYELGPRTLGMPRERVLFVSSNGWDICGAAWFGFPTFWVHRGGFPPERLGVAAADQGASLSELSSRFA